MNELGEDLILLAARSDGTLPVPEKLRFGLAGSELVRLAAAGRVDIVRGAIVVGDTAPTGDELLDEALASMAAGRLGKPKARTWVARHRPGLVERYLSRAEAAGTIRAERRKALGFIPVTRWVVADLPRAARARARLETVAASTGPVDPEQAALAGLASAIGVTAVVFPGWAGVPARKRLREAAKRAGGGAVQATSDAASAAAQRAGTDAATSAAMNAAVRAATDAAVSAAVNAATDAAVQAATDAATSAATSSAHHGGAAGGHH